MSGQAIEQGLYWRMTAYPKTVVFLSLAFVLWAGLGLTTLTKDVSVRAFIPPDHPSILTDDVVRDTFGLGDAMAVSLTFEPPLTAFSPEAMRVIAAVTDVLSAVDNVRKDRVASLTTESAIVGARKSIDVVPYYPDSDASRALWAAMPPHQGTLVSKDERSALILIEIEDPEGAAATYARIRSVAEANASGAQVHVAGPAAVSAVLSDKIDRDARILQPAVFVVVLFIVYLAFRSVSAMVGVLTVLAGATAGAMGIMAWLGVSYYAITNALPVILVAIAVADAIHLLSHYFQVRAQQPTLDERSAVVLAMEAMARPIFATTVTTAAGFCGIGMASIMPPITMFAWFAAVGVVLAWVFAMVTLPSVLVLIKPAPSVAFASWQQGRPGRLGRCLAALTAATGRAPALCVGLVLLGGLLAGAQALQLKFDRSQVENFAAEDSIRIADTFINQHFVGTSFLDVLIETEEEGGVLSADVMRRVVALQAFMEAQPHVALTVSIADYLGLLHAAIEGGPPERVLPDDDDAIAQYMLIYEVSGDPTDFEEEIDATASRALVRGTLDTVHFSESRQTVEAIQQFLDRVFTDEGVRARLAGDVNTTYHWMSRLERSHFQGVGLSLLMVLVAAVILFRALALGVLAVVPVCLTVLSIYAVMAALGVYLEPGTSMFAAISVGLGVDFAIHLIERVRAALREGQDRHAALHSAVASTGRACFFSIAALGLGFLVLTLSGLPMLQRFGGLVAFAAFASFVLTLVLVPACFAVIRQRVPSKVVRGILTLGVGLGVLALWPLEAEAKSALWVAEQVWERAEAPASRRVIDMSLTNRRGAVKQRRAVVLKIADDEQRLSRITFTAPRSIRHSAFLSHERDSAADARWLYLPATKRVRRIPAADRGDFFLGTDFSYEDVQSDLKFDLDEYEFSLLEHDEPGVYALAGRSRTQKLARQLGFARFVAYIDSTSWLPRRVAFFDSFDQMTKLVEVKAQEQVDGYWVATRIRATRPSKQHSSLFEYREISHPDTIGAIRFDPDYLAQPLPVALLGES